MRKRERPEQRHRVEFPVFISYQGANGAAHRVAGSCVNISASGANLETRDALPERLNVMLQSAQFGRLGMASVRFCRRAGMKYVVGVQFASVLKLSDPERRKILESIAEREPAPATR